MLFKRDVNQELWYSIIDDELTGKNIYAFENDTFSFHAYRWDDDLEDANDLDRDPCFYHKPSGFKLTWYKYPLRGAECNFMISHSQFRNILLDCTNSMNDFVKHEIDVWWETSIPKLDGDEVRSALNRVISGDYSVISENTRESDVELLASTLCDLLD